MTNCSNCGKTSIIRDDDTGYNVVHLAAQFKVSTNTKPKSEASTVLKEPSFASELLVQCAVKWFFSTGRRPLPLVVAVLVAEVNQVEIIRMEDLAKEVCVKVSTCRTRYKELLEQLVKVAQVLPWGKNINTKNVVKNASFVIQYMEKKSMSKPVEKKRKNPDPPRLDFTNVVTDCLRKDDVEDSDSDSDTASIKD